MRCSVADRCGTLRMFSPLFWWFQRRVCRKWWCCDDGRGHRTTRACVVNTTFYAYKLCNKCVFPALFAAYFCVCRFMQHTAVATGGACVLLQLRCQWASGSSVKHTATHPRKPHTHAPHVACRSQSHRSRAARFTDAHVSCSHCGYRDIAKLGHEC